MYRARQDLSQDQHIEGLPLGTVGGLLVSHTFPLDGDYTLQVRLFRTNLNAIRGLEYAHQIEITVDGGRLEVRDYERQAWQPTDETEMHIIRNFGQRQKVEISKATGGHGGGDDILRNLVFRDISVADPLKLPSSRAGAMSCLTGIAARHSIDEKRPIRLQDLVKLS